MKAAKTAQKKNVVKQAPMVMKLKFNGHGYKKVMEKA